MSKHTRGTVLVMFFVLVTAVPARGQNATGRPPAIVELAAGYAGFVDDATIDHTIIGGALRMPISPRVSVGPEVVYMIGPGEDRDLFLTGNVTFDVLPVRAGRRPRVNPFLVGGAGVFRHTDRVGQRDFSNVEVAATGGGGVRVWITNRVYTAGEVRLGWELHYRVNGVLGVTLWR
jgi:hypothetical protein